MVASAAWLLAVGAASGAVAVAVAVAVVAVVFGGGTEAEMLLRAAEAERTMPWLVWPVSEGTVGAAAVAACGGGWYSPAIGTAAAAAAAVSASAAAAAANSPRSDTVRSIIFSPPRRSNVPLCP